MEPELEICKCRFTVKGKRIKCELHDVEKKEPIRPTYHPLSPEDILKVGNSITDPLAQAAFFFTYLTGGRINEITDFSPNRLEVMEDRYIVRMKTLKRRTADNMRRVPIPRGSFAKCHENEMMEVVVKYLASCPSFSHPFKKWGNMSAYFRRFIPLTTEARVKGIDKEYRDELVSKPLHPHFLRHCRATHLADYYGLNDRQIQAFFNWAKPDMAVTYTKFQEVWKAFSGA